MHLAIDLEVSSPENPRSPLVGKLSRVQRTGPLRPQNRSLRQWLKISLIGLSAVLTLVCSCSSSDQTTGSDQLSSQSATSSAAPTPVTAGSETATPKASTGPTAKRRGRSAKFKHFTVTVREVKKETSSEARVLAEVCVRSLPPHPQGNRTRISWDPWSVRAGSRTVDSDPSNSVFEGAFPPDKTYRVGQCASGWIPFFTRANVTRVRYANGVGDIAVWDADHLDRAPQIRTKRSTSAEATPKEEEGESLEPSYENCTALNGDYPHGVGLPGARDRTRSGTSPVTTFKVSTRLYNANADKDRDGDGIACENR